MSYNSDLKKRIEIWTAAASAATTKDEVLEVTQSMVDYGKPIKFKLWWAYTLMWAFAGMGALTMYQWLSGNTRYASRAYEWAEMLGVSPRLIIEAQPFFLIALAIMYLAIILFHNKRIRVLCNTLMDRATLAEYGLERTDKAEVDSLRPSFGEMKRGNYERGIYDCLHGKYQGKNTSFEYRPYRLHYVDRIEKQEYDSSRKEWVTKVEYKHYDRSGIVLDFPYAKGVHICRSFETTLYGAPYKPAFIEFNKLFHCRGEDAMVLSRFLKPAVEEALVQAASNIPGLALEINKDGKLCLAARKHHVVNSYVDVLDNKEVSPMVNPKGFHELIKKGHRMVTLDRMLELVDTLVRYSDSNFSRKTVNS